MACTKQTAKQLDKKGNLPALAPCQAPDTRWGTAGEIFHQRFRLLMHPQRQGTHDFRGKCLTWLTYVLR